MGKSKKKRDKKYSGPDAKNAGDNLVRVRRVNAVVRSDWRQWVYERRKFLRTVAIVAIVAAVVIFLIVQAVLAAK